MKKVWFYVVLMLTSIFSFVLNVKQVFANDMNDVGYDIQTIIPKNQVDREKNYFDLLMKPGEKQTISLYINNTSDKDTLYNVNINQAYTNSQGFIDYVESDIDPDSSLKYHINDIVSYEKQVNVKANTSFKYDINIEMPKENFSGYIMSGIHVVKDTFDEKEKGIKNSVGYVVGLNLSQNNMKVKRELYLNEVYPDISFGKTSIVAQLQNPTMDAYGKLVYDVLVIDKSNKKEVAKKTYNNGMQIAPNSTYDFAIDWGGKPLKPGNYSLELVVKDSQGNVWEFNEDFSIDKKKAKEINSIAIPEQNKLLNQNWLTILLLLLFLILLLVVFLFQYKRYKKYKYDLSEKKVSKKKKRIKKKDS